MFLYIIGSINIIMLAFMTLRALPADALQTVDSNNYIPHVATRRVLSALIYQQYLMEH